MITVLNFELPAMSLIAIINSKILAVPKPIPQFPDLALVPARYFRKIAGNSGDPIHIRRVAERTGLQEPPGGLPAGPARCKFRGKRDLIVFGHPEGFKDEIGQRFLVRSGLTDPDVGQGSGLNQGMEKTL